MDPVARQYELHPYPPPLDDLKEWLATGRWDPFDPSCARGAYWPRGHDPRLDVLVAGCGTNQAALMALSNPAAAVTGIDVSQAAIDHERRLQDRHGLDNLRLELLPLEKVASLGRDFDLVVATGVLHHLVDPAFGLQTLGSVLRRDGVLAAMVYGLYGRFSVDVIASVFADLGLGPDDAPRARELIPYLPVRLRHASDEYAQALLEGRGPHWEGRDDVWVADAFLHPRQRSYTVNGVLELVGMAGLVFAGWLTNTPYYPHELFVPDDPLAAAAAALGAPKMWSVMERLRMPNGHCFLACRPDRPREDYVLDFAGAAVQECVPAWQRGCGVEGDAVFRPGLRLDLASRDESWPALAAAVDGRASITEIGGGGSARRLFRALWEMDLVTLALPR